MALPSDAVFVSGIEFEASHGHTAAERRSTRRFRCNVEMSRDISAALVSDRLRDTIDYWQVCQRVVEIGTGQPYKLIEALAGKIIDAVHELYPDADVTVTLEKLHPPCPGAPAASGVRLSRHARIDHTT